MQTPLALIIATVTVSGSMRVHGKERKPRDPNKAKKLSKLMLQYSKFPGPPSKAARQTSKRGQPMAHKNVDRVERR